MGSLSNVTKTQPVYPFPWILCSNIHWNVVVSTLHPDSEIMAMAPKPSFRQISTKQFEYKVLLWIQVLTWEISYSGLEMYKTALTCNFWHNICLNWSIGWGCAKLEINKLRNITPLRTLPGLHPWTNFYYLHQNVHCIVIVCTLNPYFEIIFAEGALSLGFSKKKLELLEKRHFWDWANCITRESTFLTNSIPKYEGGGGGKTSKQKLVYKSGE